MHTKIVITIILGGGIMSDLFSQLFTVSIHYFFKIEIKNETIIKDNKNFNRG